MPVDQDVSILDKWRAFSTEKAIPLQASLELTNRCNERCSHCYIPSFKDDKNRILDLAGWYKVLDELRAGGIFYIILMGGEPLLSPYFWDIAKRASELNFHVSIISNGLLLNQLDKVERLKQVGIKMVTMSFYSLDASIHDKMTGVIGSHKRTLQAIGHCIEAGVEVNVNALLTQENYKSIFDLYDWAAAKGIQMKVDAHITPKLNGDMAPTKLRLDREQLESFYKERARRWPKSLPRPSATKQQDLVCNVARGKCAVSAYGELLGCIEVRESMGLLTEKSFAELWGGEVAQKWRAIVHKDLKLKDSELEFCEHCPGMAKNQCGDENKVTEYSSLLSDVKKEIYESSDL